MESTVATATPTEPPVVNHTSSPIQLAVASVKPFLHRTIRIHVNTTEQPRPVIFNYRQLLKREQKKLETIEPIKAIVPESTLESADDLFYRELLKKAESYAVEDDDVDKDGSDEEVGMTGNKKAAPGDEYDFEDPFIDDSEMLLDEPQEYSAPEFDGFFVYHGPLDGHETMDKEKPVAPKRKAPSKAKTTTTTTTASTSKKGSSDKSRKKTTTAEGSVTEETSKKPTPASTTATTSSSATKAKRPSVTATTTTTPTSTSTIVTPEKLKSTNLSTATTTTTATTTADGVSGRKVASSADQPAKKKKKLDTKETDKDHSVANSPSTSSHEEVDKKKKLAELKPLDPEIEALVEKVRRDVVHEDFRNKAKFPLALKPTVLEAGLVMLRKNKEIGENLVHQLMAILPYNRFTLKKFLTTKSGQMRVDELQLEIDELAISLKQTIDKMMPEQQRLYDEKLAQVASQPTNPDEETPQPKFKCNDEVRKILYDIIQSEEQSIHIANQVALHKDSEKKSEGLASDGKARKLMYQRLLSCWPEGWMNSYEMSRQYSQYKLKLDKSMDKKAASNNTASSTQSDAKKRKRVTPLSSPSDEGLRKKQSIVETGIIPPDASTFNKKIKAIQQVIEINDDDDHETDTTKTSFWKQSNSMKIAALISGPNTNQKKD